MQLRSATDSAMFDGVSAMWEDRAPLGFSVCGGYRPMRSTASVFRFVDVDFNVTGIRQHAQTRVVGRPDRLHRLIKLYEVRYRITP